MAFADDSPPLVPPRKVNKRVLRARAIRRYMKAVKREEDWERVASDILMDDDLEPLFEGMDDEARAEYAMGIVRFCEWACGFSR